MLLWQFLKNGYIWLSIRDGHEICANIWFLATVQWQQKSLIWGCTEEENLIQCNCDIPVLQNSTFVRQLNLQLNYYIAWLWNSMLWVALGWCDPQERPLSGTGLPWSALLWSGQMSLVFQLQMQKHSHQSPMERKSAPLEPQRSWLILAEVPTPGPLLVCFPLNEDSKTLQFDWSKNHCLIDWNGAPLIGGWRYQWGYSYTALIKQEKSQSYWLN